MALDYVSTANRVEVPGRIRLLDVTGRSASWVGHCVLLRTRYEKLRCKTLEAMAQKDCQKVRQNVFNGGGVGRKQSIFNTDQPIIHFKGIIGKINYAGEEKKSQKQFLSFL